MSNSSSKQVSLFLKVIEDLLSSIPTENIQEAKLILKQAQNAHNQELSTFSKVREERNMLAHSHTKNLNSECTKSPKERMIGFLPDLFQDQELFIKNEDLASFAEHVLNIPIVNYKKKSRYEIIGIIICKISNKKHSELKNVVDAIEKFSQNDSLKEVVKSEKKDAQAFSWSDAIGIIGGLKG